MAKKHSKGNKNNQHGISVFRELVNKKQEMTFYKYASKIIVKPCSKSIENTQFISHAFGQPYFEEGEEWPTIKGIKLKFIFQIFNDGIIPLPKKIKMIQFYCDVGGKIPGRTADDGWEVKVYEDINHDNFQYIKKPEEHNNTTYLELRAKTIPFIEYESDTFDLYLQINASDIDLSCVSSFDVYSINIFYDSENKRDGFFLDYS